MAGAHGGRRPGSGRPSGAAWKPQVIAPKAETVSKIRKLVAAERDPLSVVIDFVLDQSLDVPTRLTAAQTCLPYLYPRLSAATVNATNTNISVDGAALLEKLDERISRLRAPEPALIDVEPAEEPGRVGWAEGPAEEPDGGLNGGRDAMHPAETKE